MAANKAQDDKNMKVLRQLSNEPDNKKCMDCGIKGTVYVCSNFNTFICTACSGLHREFSHRVKSISMTTFKPEEIKNLQAGGNAVARRKWLARWNPEDFPEPDPSDATRVKAFMKLKYIDKRWYSETGEGAQNHPPSNNSNYNNAPYNNAPYNNAPAPKPKQSPDSYPQPVPLTTILGNDIPPLHINGTHTNVNKPAAAPAPAPAPPPAVSSPGQSLVDWNARAPAKSGNSDLDDLLSIPDTSQQQAYQLQLQQQQQQNMYHQQQQLVMSQFGQTQGGWGGPAVGQGFFSPYGAPQQGFGQAQQPGFFGGVQTPPNFFAPPPAQPPNPYASTPNGSNGTISPTFGLSPSPTPLSQPNAFGGLTPTQPPNAFGGSPAQPPNAFGGSPAQPPNAFGGSSAQPPNAFGGSPAQPPNAFGAVHSPAQPPNAFGGSPAQPPNAFGALSPGQPPNAFGALSPAQPSNAFGGSPALHAGGFAQSPALHSNPGFGAQPTPAPAPQPDKFDIFASLSPLNNTANTSKPASVSNSSFPASSSISSSSSSLTNQQHTNNNPNPFGDPFGAALPPQPTHKPPAASQPAHNNHMNNDPFGGFGGGSPALSAKQPVNGGDPFGGFGGTPAPSKPPPPSNNNDPFGFGPAPTSQPQHNNNISNNNANPFGDDPFGGHQPPPSNQSSAFSPFSSNPFGQQQNVNQPKPNDAWGTNNANPFF